MRKPLATLFILAISMSLAACADNDRITVRELGDRAGLSAPVESAAEQALRATGIVERSDSLIMSTHFVESDNPDIPPARIWTDCSGDSCTLTDSLSGASHTVSLTDLEIMADASEALGTRHGVTLTWDESRHDGADATALGAWMDHGAVLLQTSIARTEEADLDIRSAIVVGNATDMPLTGSATWLGLMAGTPVAGEARGNRLIGTAALNYDMDAGGGLDVAFSAITDVDRNRPHTTATILFPDVPLVPGGTFETGRTGDRIHGALNEAATRS